MPRKRRTERDTVYLNLIRQHPGLSNKELTDRARSHPLFANVSLEAVEKDVDRYVVRNYGNTIERVDGRLRIKQGPKPHADANELSRYRLAIKHSRSLFSLPLTETAKSGVYKWLGYRKERIPVEERIEELIDTSNPGRRKKSLLWQHIQSGYPDLAKLILDYAPEDYLELLLGGGTRQRKGIKAQSKRSKSKKSELGGMFGEMFLPGNGAMLREFRETGKMPKDWSPFAPDPTLGTIRAAVFGIYESVRAGNPAKGLCTACPKALATPT